MSRSDPSLEEREAALRRRWLLKKEEASGSRRGEANRLATVRIEQKTLRRPVRRSNST
jgi:hypothetical protein